MDQGLKERLIGAAVLVALGVWLIPWVLDGPDPESSDTANALSLPVPDAPLPVRRQTLRIGEEPAPQVEPAPEAEPAVALAEPLPTSRPLDLPPPPTAEAPAEPPASAAPAPATEPARPAEPQARREPAATAAAPAPSRAETSRADRQPTTSSSATTAAAAPPPKGSFLVQLGSFSQEENAKRLAERVSTFGYKPQIVNYRANGRTMYRVRVGPHASRSEAQAAASALAAHGFPAQVVVAD